MRVFHRYANYTYKDLTPTRGDFINELGLRAAIKQFGTVVNDHHRGADLYLMRGLRGRKLFMKLPHPKVYKGPYDAKIYAAADAILTPSSEWTKRLRNGTHTPLRGTPCKTKVITIHQFVLPQFKPLQHHPTTKEIRERLGGGFIIGQFGGIRNTNYPHVFLDALPRLRKKYPHLNVVFSDEKLEMIDGITRHNFPYAMMPHVLSACDMVLYSERTDQGHFCGSLKIKEAMACGVPVLSPRYRAREEEMGTDYEFFHPWFRNVKRRPEVADSIFDLVSLAIEDEELRLAVGQRLIQRAEFFSLKQGARRLEKSFKNLIKRCR